MTSFYFILLNVLVRRRRDKIFSLHFLHLYAMRKISTSLAVSIGLHVYAAFAAVLSGLPLMRQAALCACQNFNEVLWFIRNINTRRLVLIT